VKFKIDENLPTEFVDVLNNAGYSGDTVFDENLNGAADEAILRVCAKEDRILITLDLDFADIRSYPPRSFPGFIVLRPGKQDKVHLIELLTAVVPLFSVEQVENRLWIVDETSVRIRGD
jgi:predicted nuclease of predicted toxin-antitoxin system